MVVLKKFKKEICYILFILMTIAIFIPIYHKFPQTKVTIALFSAFLLLIILSYFFTELFKKIGNFVIKFRYPIALVVFIICVLLKINMSSIGVYNEILNDRGGNNNDNVWGISRAIRSDEWLVHTPYYFSQKYNDYNKISNFMSLSGQDMIVGYNAPVKDISLLAKPLTWGYILLGNDYGLSWYWCLKLILFSLASFELTMIITKKNKLISCIGVLLIAFAPTMQWWFVPHIVDVVLWSMWLLVLGYHFFTAKNKAYRTLFTILTPLVGSVFVLALFPSLQISLGLLDIALLVLFLIRDKDKITFKKFNFINIFIMILIAGIILGYTLLTSFDAINLLYNTSYPGKRESYGNVGTFSSIFTNLTTFFLPYKDITYLNNCEVSDFIHFAPVLLLIYPIIYKYLKKKKSNDLIVGNGLLVALIISLTFYLIGFPELLAKITLFSYVNRIWTVYGYIAVLFSLWCFYILIKHKEILTNKQKICSLLIFVISYFLIISKQWLEYMPIYIYIIAILIMAFIVFSIYYNLEYLGAFVILSLVIFSSLTINPIRRGSLAITNHPLVDEVKKIYKEDEGYFLTVDSLQLQSLLLANGVKVLNAVNFYPDFDKWEKLDSSKKYYDYYNRYLHMVFKLTDGKNSFKLSNADSLSAGINPKYLKSIDVKYLLVGYDASDILDDNNVKYEVLYNENYYIFKLI